MVGPVLRYAAFSDDPAAGNPAGVMLDASALSAAEMQDVATELGYSESAFLRPADAPGEYHVRYFSPAAEVAFCGHATIASAVALADVAGPGGVLFHTRAGPVPVRTAAAPGGGHVATLTSPAPHVDAAAPGDVAEALAALGWSADDLDPALAPRVAFAGEHHLVLAAGTRERLAALDYDVPRLAALMAARRWITLQLVWRAAPTRFASRNPFPAGNVTEDPATGAAAAAFGAYLRELGEVTPPATITIVQGEDLGRPGVLTVTLHADRAEIDVSGAAVPI